MKYRKNLSILSKSFFIFTIHLSLSSFSYTEVTIPPECLQNITCEMNSYLISIKHNIMSSTSLDEITLGVDQYEKKFGSIEFANVIDGVNNKSSDEDSLLFKDFLTASIEDLLNPISLYPKDTSVQNSNSTNEDFLQNQKIVDQNKLILKYVQNKYPEKMETLLSKEKFCFSEKLIFENNKNCEKMTFDEFEITLSKSLPGDNIQEMKKKNLIELVSYLKQLRKEYRIKFGSSQTASSKIDTCHNYESLKNIFSERIIHHLNSHSSYSYFKFCDYYYEINSFGLTNELMKFKIRWLKKGQKEFQFLDHELHNKLIGYSYLLIKNGQ